MRIREKKRGRPRKYKDIKMLQKEVEKYVDSCIYTNYSGRDFLIKRYRKKELVNRLGICMNTFNRYKKDKELRDAIEGETVRVECILESRLYINGLSNEAMKYLVKEFDWIRLYK